MAGARYPITLVDGVPVVEAPQEVDARSAEWFRKVLLQAAFTGHAAVVVDLTGTQFCDLAGVHVLVSAHQRAVAKAVSCCWSSPPAPPCAGSLNSPASTSSSPASRT